MTRERVKALLREDPTRVKEVSLSDGSRYRVKGIDDWAADDVHALTIVENAESVHIAYVHVVSIREMRKP